MPGREGQLLGRGGLVIGFYDHDINTSSEEALLCGKILGKGNGRDMTKRLDTATTFNASHQSSWPHLCGEDLPIQNQKSSYPTRRGNSSYAKKSFLQHISYIEPHLVHITDPLALAMEVLPHEWHFLPKHPDKNIRFYKSILSQEKSVQIENIFNSRDPSIVLYHKFIITGFVSCQDWGQHPFELRILKNYRSPSGSALYYSYYDYMDAFEKVLFIQNQNFSHSWFMMFSREFMGQLPSWFLRWWEMFGSVPQIFPDPLQDALRYFDLRYKTLNHRSQFPVILLFSQRYRIHWISKWEYKINTNLLDREFLVKWWDGLRIEQIINQVYRDYPQPIQQPIAHRTRSQSSLDSLESEEQVSPTASVASVNHNPIDHSQDSQDPYSGYNLDSD
ncbi:hypothetical protein ACB092_10G181600 [Castanea dentata]